MNEKVIEKLQKLLALSASDNENEAALAMSKAEKLMRENNLSVADVAMNGSGAHVTSAETAGMTKSVQSWERHLGSCIAHTFNGKAIISRLGRGQGWKFTFVAGRTDLVIIVDLYERLRQSIRRMSKSYVRNNPDPFISPRTLHNSYRIGVVLIIQERLEKLRENTRPDDARNAFGMTGNELMVIKDKAVEQRVRKLFPRLKKNATRFSGVDANAYRQGKADGQNISLHRSVGEGVRGPVTIGQ